MAGSVAAVLSTGHCGTRWLTACLRDLHPGIHIEHEAIGPLYSPRRYFRGYEDPAAILDVPEVRRHLDAIETAPEPYVETGWPLFPALPLLAGRLGDRLRIVHLTRHPVPTALSHLADGSYAGSPRDDAYTRLATLGPQDPNVFQPEYASTWDQLSAYEKCLFWWTEVNLFALEFPGRFPHVAVLRISYEAIATGDPNTIARLLEFLGLPWKERWLELAEQIVDRWPDHTDRGVDPLEVHRHPATVEVARELGYDVSRLNLGELLTRVRGAPDSGRDRIVRFA
jgi:hypothetical protein